MEEAQKISSTSNPKGAKRKKSCADCRLKKIKCEYFEVTKSCKNCTRCGLSCTGPIDTEAKKEKKAKKENMVKIRRGNRSMKARAHSPGYSRPYPKRVASNSSAQISTEGGCLDDFQVGSSQQISALPDFNQFNQNSSAIQSGENVDQGLYVYYGDATPSLSVGLAHVPVTHNVEYNTRPPGTGYYRPYAAQNDLGSSSRDVRPYNARHEAYYPTPQYRVVGSNQAALRNGTFHDRTQAPSEYMPQIPLLGHPTAMGTSSNEHRMTYDIASLGAGGEQYHQNDSQDAYTSSGCQQYGTADHERGHQDPHSSYYG